MCFINFYRVWQGFIYNKTLRYEKQPLVHSLEKGPTSINLSQKLSKMLVKLNNFNPCCESVMKLIYKSITKNMQQSLN